MGCAGKCCAAFPYPSSPDELRARWEGKDVQPQDEKFKRDDLFIADMLIRLEPQEIIERGEQFDLWRALESIKVNMPYEMAMYTCRHWDADSKLCTAYEDRPTMCADFPYDGTCEHGCGFRPTKNIRTAWAAIRVKHAAAD